MDFKKLRRSAVVIERKNTEQLTKHETYGCPSIFNQMSCKSQISQTHKEIGTMVRKKGSSEKLCVQNSRRFPHFNRHTLLGHTNGWKHFTSSGLGLYFIEKRRVEKAKRVQVSSD
jgi:hypothetical protein